MLGRSLTVGLNLKICGKILPIHPNERTMQKDSVYLPCLGCYAETICPSTHFGVICGNFLSKKKLGCSSYWLGHILRSSVRK